MTEWIFYNLNIYVYIYSYFFFYRSNERISSCSLALSQTREFLDSHFRTEKYSTACNLQLALHFLQTVLVLLADWMWFVNMLLCVWVHTGLLGSRFFLYKCWCECPKSSVSQGFKANKICETVITMKGFSFILGKNCGFISYTNICLDFCD